MKILSWNVWGLGKPRTIRRLRHSLKTCNPQLVFFSLQMERVRRSCGFANGIEVDSEGTRGGLCMAWKNDITIILKSFSKRHIDVIVDDAEISRNWHLTGFYSTPYVRDREDSWAVLKTLSHEEDIHWFVCGDFNEILYGCEKQGGLPREERMMDLFRRTLEECHLNDVGFSERWFTWERGNLPKTNIRERLDRGVVTTSWMALFPEVVVQHLVNSFSDHCPLLIEACKEEVMRRKGNFKFEA